MNIAMTGLFIKVFICFTHHCLQLIKHPHDACNMNEWRGYMAA